MAGMYLIANDPRSLLAPLTPVASFATQPLPDDKVTPHLSALIQTYLSTMSSIGAETWIMHGTLLSWWWNQKVFLPTTPSGCRPEPRPYNRTRSLTSGSLDLPMGQ